MTVYARLAVDLPAFREALAETRQRCVVQQLTRRGSTTVRCAVRVPPPLAGALRTDPTVRETIAVDDTGAGRILQVDVAPEAVTYDTLVDRAAILDRIEATAEGWSLDCRFPDEERLQDYHRTCRQRDLRIRLCSLSTGPDGGPTTLTPAQWELLDAARREGYYDIPRSVTLRELAAELGLSRQAASERLRRGLGALLDRHLPASPGGDDPPRIDRPAPVRD